jgi:hypothetical protein
MNQHLQRLPSLALRTSPSLPCAIEVQDVWGPQVHGCGSDFDFTLLFQEVVLSISPLVVGICWAVLRIWKLMRRNAVVAAPVLRILKLVSDLDLANFYHATWYCFADTHVGRLCISGSSSDNLTRRQRDNQGRPDSRDNCDLLP